MYVMIIIWTNSLNAVLHLVLKQLFFFIVTAKCNLLGGYKIYSYQRYYNWASAILKHLQEYSTCKFVLLYYIDIVGQMVTTLQIHKNYYIETQY